MRFRSILSVGLALSLSVFGGSLQAQSASGSGGASAASTLASMYMPLGNLAGLSSAKASEVMAVPEDFAKLKIAPGFLLDVQVYDEPDLSNQFRVDDAGNITIPLIGTLQVSGDTLEQARELIQTAFRNGKILNEPQVTLNILQYAPTMVTVLGEVNQPGRLQMLAPHNLLDVISFAGGENALAGGVIELRHEQDGKMVDSTYQYGRDGSPDGISKVIVHDGDTVTVPRAGIVYVLGAVTRPGGYMMQEDGKLDAAQALALAWGTLPEAKVGDVRIIRRRPDGTFIEFPLNYTKMTAGKVAPPALQAQDIVYVPMSHIKAPLMHGSTVLGETTSATIYALR